MSVLDQQTLQSTRSLSVAWKCGYINVGAPGQDHASEAGLMDWSREGIGAGVAAEQIDIILDTTMNAIDAMIGLLREVRRIGSELDFDHDMGSMLRGAKSLDVLIEQLLGVVQSSALGSINLLGGDGGYAQIPYFLTEVKDVEEYHNFITMGLSIIGVREPIEGQVKEKLVGLYSLSTEEENAVVWLSSPQFWLDIQEEESLNCNENLKTGLRMEVERVLHGANHLSNSLVAIKEQFSEYKKRVSEVVR